MSVLAIIPARGGSKGVPGKNIMLIGGRPLLARTITSVKECSLVDTVLVTTDDQQIGLIANECGAELIKRPKELAEDSVSSEAAMIHACQAWKRKTERSYDLVLLVQNTSPFHSPIDMGKVIRKLTEENYNACITVVKSYEYFWQKSGDTHVLPFQKRSPRQLRSPLYQEAGSLYCVRYDPFVKSSNLFPNPLGIVEIPWWRGFEIDDPEDVEVAELLCERYDSRHTAY